MPTIRVYDIANDEWGDRHLDDDAYAQYLRAPLVTVTHPEGEPGQRYLSPDELKWLAAYDLRSAVNTCQL